MAITSPVARPHTRQSNLQKQAKERQCGSSRVELTETRNSQQAAIKASRAASFASCQSSSRAKPYATAMPWNIRAIRWRAHCSPDLTAAIISGQFFNHAVVQARSFLSRTRPIQTVAVSVRLYIKNTS